jgi:trans-aconitate 2-methyltransferase
MTHERDASSPPGRPRDWDAATYDRVSDPMTRWGGVVLDRLPLAGDEIVLDAGCGSGRVTEQLAERLPRGRVVALDGSPAMIDEARRRLARFGDRISYLVADLRAPLPLAGGIDAAFSTATFHWIGDHDALFRNLSSVLRPGGRLVAQCGGRGCLDRVVAVLERLGDGWPGPWTFAGAEETRARLEAAGFVEVETWLHDEPTRLDPGEPLESYLRTVILGSHLERLPRARHDDFIRAVADGLGEPLLDYVRLNITAVRAGGGSG